MITHSLGIKQVLRMKTYFGENIHVPQNYLKKL